MIGTRSFLGRDSRKFVALSIVLALLLGVCDTFFCGLEVSALGAPLALHVDAQGDLHSDMLDFDHFAGDTKQNPVGNTHKDCAHGHCHHVVPMWTASAADHAFLRVDIRAVHDPAHYSPHSSLRFDRPPRA